MTGREGAPNRKLAGVPVAVRRLWSLLYRAERRHAERLDALRRDVDDLRDAVVENTRTLVAYRRTLDAFVAVDEGLIERVARLEDYVEGADPP